MAGSIYDKQRVLKPSAMRTVAERRFDDAQALRETEENARANGVAYLVGFVIEILLKAKLVAKYPQIAKKRHVHDLKEDEREIWGLIWRQHELGEMLFKLAEFEAALIQRGNRDGKDYAGELKKICGTWTIFARYSSHTILMDEAAEILERVRMLKEVLK